MLTQRTSEDDVTRLGDRLAALVAEARAAARQHVGELDEALARVAALAGAVADGGPAYPVGVRSVCRHLRAPLQTQQRALRGFQPVTG